MLLMLLAGGPYFENHCFYSREVEMKVKRKSLKIVFGNMNCALESLECTPSHLNENF
jgi:hypothetical protein